MCVSLRGHPSCWSRHTSGQNLRDPTRTCYTIAWLTHSHTHISMLVSSCFSHLFMDLFSHRLLKGSECLLGYVSIFSRGGGWWGHSVWPHLILNVLADFVTMHSGLRACYWLPVCWHVPAPMDVVTGYAWETKRGKVRSLSPTSKQLTSSL